MGNAAIRFEDNGETFGITCAMARAGELVRNDVSAGALTPAEIAMLTTKEIVQTVVEPFLRMNPEDRVGAGHLAFKASISVMLYGLLERSHLSRSDDGKREAVYQLAMTALMLLMGPPVVVTLNKTDVAEMVNRLCDQIESFAAFHQPGRG